MNSASAAMSKQTNATQERASDKEDAYCSTFDDEAIVEGETLSFEKEDVPWLLKTKANGCEDPSLLSAIMCFFTPSRCKKYSWVHFSNKEGKDYGSGKNGKWMLFLDRVGKNEGTGLTALDDAWRKLMNMDDFASTGVTSAKCSTASPDGCAGPHPETDPNGVICCYTPDYTNKAQLRKAAAAIRKLVDYPRHMFFKTDSATYEKKYSWKGDKNIAIYKYTTINRLYEKKSDDNQWYPVYFEEDNVRRSADINSIVSKLADINSTASNMRCKPTILDLTITS